MDKIKIRGGFKRREIIKWLEKKVGYKQTLTWRADNAEDWNNLEELRTILDKKKEVIISINKGVSDVHGLPKGIKVKIVDFDREGCEEELLEKFEGDDAIISEYYIR